MMRRSSLGGGEWDWGEIITVGGVHGENMGIKVRVKEDGTG